MPALHTNIVTLPVRPNMHGIDRSVLAEIAPDREELLLDESLSIGDLSRMLKLCVVDDKCANLIFIQNASNDIVSDIGFIKVIKLRSFRA
jgi:hypothetical protein